ncbi:unnamed protein product [Miscanthus lutarioriparius]|uniref:Uncharacterized protein n=1 Tax=Miscanthus lutarioriparius TaxID=422564 RepID=A0A811SK52_9POAL|nr:unnamed protein product [Miscanthus lutarioriparius]
MVGSAVVQGAVSQILSDLIDRHEGKEKLKDNENLERLEMAHIKLEAALETSEKWQITDASLLRWRKKSEACCSRKKHWENLHNCVSQWNRPNPSCCKELDQHELHCSSNTGMPVISLESVIGVHLQCQVSLHGGDFCLQDSQYLIAGLLFMPHGSSEDLLAADKSSAIVVNHSEEQHCAHTDITLAQLEEITLPKAVDYFCQNTDTLVYQMLWKSKHGAAYIQVVKASTTMHSTRRMTRALGQERQCNDRIRSWRSSRMWFLTSST